MIMRVYRCTVVAGKEADSGNSPSRRVIHGYASRRVLSLSMRGGRFPIVATAPVAWSRFGKAYPPSKPSSAMIGASRSHCPGRPACSLSRQVSSIMNLQTSSERSLTNLNSSFRSVFTKWRKPTTLHGARAPSTKPHVVEIQTETLPTSRHRPQGSALSRIVPRGG